MRVISDRISIVKKDDVFSLVILPTSDKKKLWLMFAWLFAWTVCGFIVIANYFQLSNKESKLFIIIYLSFWLYYEIRIGRAYLWKRWGKEKLWIKNDVLHYMREMSGKGKVNEYNLDLINELKLIEVHRSSFADTINQSFWIKGGERLEFQYQAKVIRFAMQISDEEAREILREMKSFLR